MIRRALLALGLWVVVAWLSTGPGPRVDCYERAVWTGRVFIGTGEWRCLK